MALKSIVCRFVGHDWSATHGMKGIPLDGAVCMRCPKEHKSKGDK